jgi:hypothetical protein
MAWAAGASSAPEFLRDMPCAYLAEVASAEHAASLSLPGAAASDAKLANGVHLR